MSRFITKASQHANNPTAILPVGSQLLTTTEVANYLHVSARTVERKRKNGTLIAYRIGNGGRYRYRAKDVQDLLVPDNNSDIGQLDLKTFINRQTNRG